MVHPFLYVLAFFLLNSCSSKILVAKSKPPQKAQVFYGTPYSVQNKIYYPLTHAVKYNEKGVASWYGPKFHGKLTSNKEVYNMHSMTAAHKTLPFNAKVRVVNLNNSREVVVRINDRGPFVDNRIIDLSFSAAKKLDMIKNGTAQVKLTLLNSTSSNTKTLTPSNYSVQIGIYKKKNNALKLAQSIPNGRTEAIEKNGSQFYRVLVGRYQDYKNALQKLDNMKAQGFPGAFIASGKN